MNILLVEDSDNLRRSLRIGLSKLGHQIDDVGDGAEALSILMLNDYDLAIIDWMLPSVDGLSVIQSIRKAGKQTRILVLSARDLPGDKVEGLMAGADDYLAKPFSFDELEARITALMRRGPLQTQDDSLILGPCRLDKQTKTFFIHDHLCELTPTEYKILECLFQQQEKVVTIERLSEYLVGKFDAISKNSIEAHISSIKRKARAMGAEIPIKNRRGFGYMVSDNG